MSLEWFFLTLSSAVAFSVLDLTEKHLVSKRIRSPLMLAIFVAIFYPINFAVIPLLFTVDVAIFPSVVSFLVGVAMGLAYLLFMKSIQVEEVSRVVTLHYTYPLFIAPLAFFFLDESLTFANYVGIVLLVASTFMISYRKIGRAMLYSPALPLMTGLNVFIAVENVLAKYLFDFYSFWSFLFWLIIGMVSIRLLFLLIPRIRRDFARIGFDKQLIGYGFAIAFLFLAANMLYYAAISLQLVSLVSALSAVQPMFLLAIAAVITFLRPAFVYEELTRAAMLNKSVAVVLVFLGTYLITLNV